MNKFLWQMLTTFVAAIVCAGIVSCGDDDENNEDTSGTTPTHSGGKKLWYVWHQNALDRDHTQLYEYVYDYDDDGKVRTLSSSDDDTLDDFSDADADKHYGRIHYEYSSDAITATGRNFKYVCYLTSGRITRIDCQDVFYYAFDYDKQGRLINMSKIYYDSSFNKFNYTQLIEWNGDEIASCQYYRIVTKDYMIDYSIEPSEVENARCDAQFSPLMYVVKRFTEGTVSSGVRVDQAIHPLEAYFGKKPAHLIGSISHHAILGRNEQIIDQKKIFTYNVVDGYVQSVDYVSKTSPLGNLDELPGLQGRYRTLVWK